MSQVSGFTPSNFPGGYVQTIHTQDGHDVTPTAGVINLDGAPSGILTTTGTVGPNTATVNLVNGTDGQLIIGGGAAAAWATLTAGTDISITNGANSITINSTASGGLTTLTGDTGTATESGGNINVTGGGLSAGNSGAVFTGSSDNLQITFNYLSLPNTTTKDYGTIYFGGSSNTIIHNLYGAFFGNNVGLNIGSPTRIDPYSLIGIGTGVLTARVGQAGVNNVYNITAIGQGVMNNSSTGGINSVNNLVAIGTSIISGQTSSVNPPYPNCENIVLMGNNILNGNTSAGLYQSSSIIFIGNNINNVSSGGLELSSYDIAIGDTLFNSLLDGSNNIAIGYNCFNNALYPNGNIGIGSGCGSNYTNNEGGNILFNSAGIVGESSTMHIDGLSANYQSGIAGVTVSNAAMVTINTSTGQLGSASMPSGGITTINVDNSGSVTGSTIDLYANSGSANAGSSVAFVAASGTEIDLQVTDSNSNTMIGQAASTTGSYNTGLGYAAGNGGNGSYGVYLGYGATSGNGSDNVVIGYGSGSSLSAGADNTLIGYSAYPLGNGSNNVVIGSQTAANGGGSSNIIIGFTAGSNYTGGESGNILFNSAGIASESSTMHIDGLSANYQSGIAGVTVSNTNMVTIDTSTGQLGSATIPSGGTITTVFNSSGSWTANASTTYVTVIGFSGGGGGGGGGNNNGGAALVSGGSGGPAGNVFMYSGPIAFFGTSATVTVGAGGGGGTSSADSSGMAGSAGGQSSFGNMSMTNPATGGNGGVYNNPGTAAGVTGGSQYTQYASQTGLISGIGQNLANGGNAANSILGFMLPTSGGGGGGFDTTGGGGNYNGGNGADITSPDGTIIIVAGGTGGNGSLSSPNGSNGNDAPTSGGVICGGSGGGGGGCNGNDENAGTGGNGGFPGGGGGGGSADPGSLLGIGGTGGAGQIIVIEWL